MDRQALLRAAELAETAGTYATLTASHANLKPETADQWCRRTEDTLYAALEALAEAQRMPAKPDFFPVAADIVRRAA